MLSVYTKYYHSRVCSQDMISTLKHVFILIILMFFLLHLSTAILTLKLTEIFVYFTDAVLGKLRDIFFTAS